MKIALNAKAAASLEAFKFTDANGAVFREPHAQITQGPCDVFILRVEFAQQPSRCPGGIEEFGDRPEILLGLGAFDLGLFAAIGEKLLAQFFGEKLHGRPPLRERTR